MRPTIIILFCLLGNTAVFSQVMDTLQLNEVQVYGAPISKYASGARVVQLEKSNDGTLNQQIGDQLPIYFKNYGNGQLSTVAFRGTSASQTAVLWNGIPVNSPTLGQTDFSLWPAFLLDDVAVQFGGSASLYGTGAIGGSVFLESTKPKVALGDTDISLMRQVGSFGQSTSGLNFEYGNESVLAKTRLFYHAIDNDFTYPLKGRQEVTITQENAAVQQIGIAHDLYYMQGDQSFSFHSQLLQNDREIQPPVATNGLEDELEDINLRLALDHQIDRENGQWTNTLAYIINDQYYNRDSRVISQQFTGLTNYEVSLGNSSSLRVGANINHFIAETENYFETDWLTDLFASLSIQLIPLWQLSINLRQSLDNTDKPFAPSIGSKLQLVKKKSLNVHWTAQASRAYRLPTLNDRFWQPGGNPNLNAEESISIETGLNWAFEQNRLSISNDINIFQSWVDEWIIWLPNESAVWSPDNIREVNVWGFETSSSLKYRFNKFQLGLNANYSYTESINESGLTEGDGTAGNQLPYVPEHQFNIGLNVHYLSWSLRAMNNYTGSRFTTDDNTSLNKADAFNLVNLRLGKMLKIEYLTTTLSLEVRNLTNIYYENLINRAMPGRSYLLTLNFNI